MYDGFAAWAKDNAVRAWGEKNFALVMSQKGFSKEKHRTGMRYLSVRLKNVPNVSRRHGDEPSRPSDDYVIPA